MDRNTRICIFIVFGNWNYNLSFIIDKIDEPATVNEEEITKEVPDLATRVMNENHDVNEGKKEKTIFTRF